MPEYARVVTFEIDEASSGRAGRTDQRVRRAAGDIPATRITVLADRAAGRVVVATRFGSEEDLRKGAATLEAMSPPEGGNVRRVSVDVYEVALERSAS